MGEQGQRSFVLRNKQNSTIVDIFPQFVQPVFILEGKWCVKRLWPNLIGCALDFIIGKLDFPAASLAIL